MNFQPELYTFSLGQHKDMDVIWIHFPNNEKLKLRLRESVVAHWSYSQQCWYTKDVAAYRELFRLPPKSIGKNALLKIGLVNQPEFQCYLDQLELKAYSPNTVRTYCIEFAQFLYVLKNHPVKEISTDQLRSYFLYCIRRLKLSENQLNSRVNALKFYYEQVLHQEKMFLEIPRPKKPLLLPKSLNISEIKRLFNAIDNLKHLMILRLCYGMGLRVSEIVQLKVADIDSQAMRVHIQQGKGKKDRYVNLPHSVLKELRLYYEKYRPQEYLFEGQYGGHYSVRSAQSIFEKAMRKAQIKKKIGIHGLRHSYATHLLEYGTDISLIQKLLGHNNVKTTLVYAHISRPAVEAVKSPLDRL